MEQKFYICRHCGNIIAFVKESGVPVICCGEPMQLIIPNTVDASAEKHVPVIKTEGNKITIEIGSAPHPMTPEHYIEWISLQTKQGNQRKTLKPGDEPKADFMITDDDNIEAAYAYCNIHGLWKNDK